MFSFWSSRSQYKTISLSIVTSASVISAVVKIFSGKDAVQKPVILFSQELPISTRGGTLDQISQEVIDSMSKTLHACRSVHGNYDEHICMVGEPWTKIASRSIVQEKNKKFHIHEKLIQELVARDKARYEEERSGDESQEWELLTPSKPIVDVNGYRVGRLKKTMGEKMEITYLLGMIPRSFANSIRRHYEEMFHAANVTLVALEYAYYYALDASAWDQSIMIMVGGVSSSVVRFERGILKELEPIPFGISDMKRNIMKTFEVSERYIDQVVAFTHDTQLLTHKRDVYVERLIGAYSEWGEAFDTAYTHIKRTIHQLPQHITIIEPVPWFSLYHGVLEITTQRKVISPHEAMIRKMLFSHESHAQSSLLALGVLWAFYNRS